MLQNFEHAVIYQEKPHGISSFVHWLENWEDFLGETQPTTFSPNRVEDKVKFKV